MAQHVVELRRLHIAGRVLVNRERLEVRLAAGDLGLTKHSYDLRFGKMALSHSNLLSSRYEKIQLMHPLNHGEDYHDVDGARGCAVPIPAGGAALSQTTAGLADDSTGWVGS